LNFIYEEVRNKNDNWEHFSRGFNNLNQLIKFTVIVIWLVIYNFIHYNKRFQDIKYANLITENKLKEAELINLRQQLNPHFLFNALSSIHALVSFKEEKAEIVVLNLSDLMRYTLNYEQKDFVTVEEEMDVVRKYLELEKLRFDNRLTYELDIHKDTLAFKMPLLMTQTLAENAIKHSVRYTIKGGHVRISTHLTGDFFEIQVINSRQYAPSVNPTINNKNGGIGLENINRRLNMYFGNTAHFAITNLNDKEVKAVLRLPKIE
jgi:two-component system, LytTR family, sensor kinase